MKPLDVSVLELHLQNLERLGWTPEDTIDLLLFIRERLYGRQMKIGDILTWNVVDTHMREENLCAMVEKAA